MSHFSAAEWYEHVSQTGSSDTNSLIESHLREGCSECRKLLEFWTEIIKIARREPNYHPPGSAVQSVKEAFQPQERWRWFPQIAQLAKLLFDSLQAPLPAAVRGSTISTRQLLLEAKPFVIDLRIEQEAIRKQTRVMGQVLNSEEPARNVTDVDIFLLNGEQLVARTTVNGSGEFQLEFKDQEGLQLFVDIHGRKIVEILLPSSLTSGLGKSAVAK